MRIGLFGIGLDVHWPQSAGLKEHLEGSVLLRHHAACQRGAVLTANDVVIGTRAGREHGPTLASSVVAEEFAGRSDVWF